MKLIAEMQTIYQSNVSKRGLFFLIHHVFSLCSPFLCRVIYIFQDVERTQYLNAGY